MPDDVASDRVTQPTGGDVADYLRTVPDAARREDAEAVARLLREVTGVEPELWGTMIGFGRVRYTAADRKVRETLAVGLAPRKAELALYGLTFYGSNADLLARLGRHRVGKGCLYVRRLADVDAAVLRELIERGWAGREG